MEPVAFFVQNREVIVALHIFGNVVGLGGTTVADFLFFKFLKDLKISPAKAQTLEAISKIIWTGLFILIITGLALLLAAPDRLLSSDKFLAKLAIINVIIINGVALNFYVTPRLPHVDFISTPPSNRLARRIAFALGAVSATSWWSVFILGSFHYSPLPLFPLLYIYLGLLMCGIIGSQVMEYMLTRKGRNMLPQTSAPTPLTPAPETSKTL